MTPFLVTLKVQCGLVGDPYQQEVLFVQCPASPLHALVNQVVWECVKLSVPLWEAEEVAPYQRGDAVALHTYSVCLCMDDAGCVVLLMRTLVHT